MQPCPEADKLAIKVIAATVCLIAELQRVPVLGEPPSKLDDLGWCVRDRPDEPDLAAAAVLGDGDRNAGLVHVKADVKNVFSAIVSPGRLRRAR
jgi:hypothetical protein